MSARTPATNSDAPDRADDERRAAPSRRERGQPPRGAGSNATVGAYDPAKRRRLRWRARRGLLENDLLLTRYLDRHEENLSDDQVHGLDELLDLTDNDLLDLVLSRREPEKEELSGHGQAVLGQLRTI